MVANRRKKLAAPGVEVLTDGLSEPAGRVEGVDDLVERLIAPLRKTSLDAILRRAYSKAYDPGVSDLKKHDTLAPAVSDGRGFGGHVVYLKHLGVPHARKHSFWPRYEK